MRMVDASAWSLLSLLDLLFPIAAILEYIFLFSLRWMLGWLQYFVFRIIQSMLILDTAWWLSFIRTLLTFFFLKTFIEADLRDDKQFFIDHPGAVPITTAQVMFSSSVLFISVLCFPLYVRFISLPFQGEELRKLIGAPAYIECSSKTQQVFEIWTCNCNMWRFNA